MATVTLSFATGHGSPYTVWAANGANPAQIYTTVSVSSPYIYTSVDTATTTVGTGTVGTGIQMANFGDLLSVTLPAGVTTIASSAFQDCNNAAFTSITLPTGFTTLSEYSFYFCANLATFTNNSTVLTTFGDNCFGGNAYTSFVIPNSVTSYGGGVFASCNNLVSLTIGSLVPAGITFIQYISGFQNYFVDAGSTNYAASSGILYNFGSTTLLSLPPSNATTNLVIPSTVTTINNNSCSGTGNLLSVTIPATVTSIGSAAFSGNNALTTVIFADGSNPNFNNYAFASCFNLTDITFPNSILGTGFLSSGDFIDCTKLLTNSIPPGGPYLGTLHTNALPGDYVYDLFLPAGTNGFYLNYDYQGTPIVCFKEGSKILTEKGYIAVQDLRNGDLVKTVSSGFKKIEHIGYSKMYNNVNEIRSNDKLYRCSTSEYPELSEDLIITGCHAILIKNFKDQEQIEKTQEVLGKIYITDKHYRLPACVDERTKIFEEEGVHTIWHFSLEHSDYYMNYGVYANGLLVETTSNRMMVELSGMTLV
jgi:hypothetical protein